MSVKSPERPIPYYDVVIATPGHSMQAGYVQSLVKTLEVLQRRKISYKFLNRYSSFVPTARELTAIDSFRHDYSTNRIGNGNFYYGKIFWIDSDIEWEPEDFLKLYDSKLEVVSGLYVLDEAGTVAASYADHRGAPTRVNKVEFLLHEEPVEVTGVGFGFICVKSGVFEKIPRPWFGIAKMQWEEGSDLKVNVGEDYSWCARAQGSGYKIYLDPTVKVLHHKSTIFKV